MSHSDDTDKARFVRFMLVCIGLILILGLLAWAIETQPWRLPGQAPSDTPAAGAKSKPIGLSGGSMAKPEGSQKKN